MRRITLIAREDEDLGGVGLIIDGMRNFDVINPAQDGRGLAHDLFEHVNGIENIGSGAGDELIAIGALWYVRGRHGDLSRPNLLVYTTEQSVGYDVTLCMRRWLNDDRRFNMPVPKAMENHIGGSLPYIFRAVDLEEVHEEIKSGDLFSFLLSARHFLNHGYAKARRRYKGDGMKANSMFWNVADELDERIFGNHVELYEGQRFTLGYSRNDAKVTEQYSHDDYY